MFLASPNSLLIERLKRALGVPERALGVPEVDNERFKRALNVPKFDIREVEERSWRPKVRP